MLILKYPFSFNSITDPDILKLVKMRHDQLGNEMFGSVIIVEGDYRLLEIEKRTGIPHPDLFFR
jgi:hypothetical protein